MKTRKIIVLLLMAIMTVACNKNDDDLSSEQQITPQKLTAGIWYFESKTPDNYTACEKKGNIDFKDDGTLSLEAYAVYIRACESLATYTGSYTLDGSTLTFTILVGDTQTLTINSISESELKMTNEDSGEVFVFDRTEG